MLLSTMLRWLNAKQLREHRVAQLPEREPAAIGLQLFVGQIVAKRVRGTVAIVGY